jgi:hypothetical protein
LLNVTVCVKSTNLFKERWIFLWLFCAGIIPLTFDEVNKMFNEYELKLEETEYVNARTGMKYTCLRCGYQGSKSADNLKKSKGCKGCATIENSNNQRTPYHEVKKIIEHA